MFLEKGTVCVSVEVARGVQLGRRRCGKDGMCVGGGCGSGKDEKGGGEYERAPAKE